MEGEEDEATGTEAARVESKRCDVHLMTLDGHKRKAKNRAIVGKTPKGKMLKHI